MLSVREAHDLILTRCQPLAAELTPLSTSALGRVLAETVAADLDMPPFDKALMDGYALRHGDVRGPTTLRVIEEVVAGQAPTCEVGPGQATRIMTGAPIPNGADTVMPLEQTQLLADGQVRIEAPAMRAGANILRRGQEMRQGEEVLSAGTVLRPQHFGVLATLGRTAVQMTAAPRLAVIATGDELVEPAMLPGPGQIRNSNAPMLLAQASRAGAIPRYLGIARDRIDSLRALIREGLETADIVVLSGGVSAGKLDLVPGVLAELGVEPHFHKVRMKPGKPLFFGSLSSRLVFGLPGNPVSSFVCFELFLRPAVRRLAGFADLDLPRVSACLAEAWSHAADRPTYYPARLEGQDGGWSVQPLPWLGSADLRAFLQANGLLVLPAGQHSWQGGQNMEVLRLDA